MDYDVKHDEQKHSFYVIAEGQECFLRYSQTDEHCLNFSYIYVPPALRGKHIADAIVKAGVEYAIKNNMKIIPSCSFVLRSMQHKKEWREIICEDEF